MTRIAGLIVPLLAAAWLALILTSCSAKGELRPMHAEDGTLSEIGDQPQLVTFPELQANPEAYKDTFIRVSGSFYRLPPPECIVYSGPTADWSLVSDNLRLDAHGFEKSIPIVPDGTEMTVDGIFRQYEGPLGCGKRPASGIAWFLEATRIVQPNPLARVIRSAGQAGTGIISTPRFEATLPGTAAPQTTQEAPTGISPQISTSVPTTTPSPAVTNGGLPTITPSPTASSEFASVTPTRTPSPGPGTPTATRTPTPSPLPGTSTLTPTSPAQPTAGPTQPPLSTATPGGYPVPPTADSSPTSAYPG